MADRLTIGIVCLGMLIATVTNVVRVRAEGKADDTENSEMIAEVITEPETETESEAEEVVTLHEIPKVHGIYVTGPVVGGERLDEMLEIAEQTDINTFVIDVKEDSGKITYNMDLDVVEEYGLKAGYVDDISALMDKLEEAGIYTIARVVCFKDPALAEARTDLALKRTSGANITDSNGNAFVNPYKEEVWDHIATIAEKAAEDGFDEIQFDYCRFPIVDETSNPIDYGVDTSTYSKEECISNFYAYLDERLHAKGIVFGADLFGTIIGSPEDTASTGQNYVTIAEHADVVCPMVYPSHYGSGAFNLSVPDAQPYECISGAMEKSVAALAEVPEDECAIVRPWLQAFTAKWVSGYISYGTEQLQEQIQAVYDAGYDQFIFWNASCRYDHVVGTQM